MGDDHFPVNRSKDNVTRAIQNIFTWITSNTFSWLVRLMSNKQAKLRVTLQNLFARFSAKRNIDGKN